MKLTYTKSDLQRMLNRIPLINYPAELLTESQLKIRAAHIQEFELACKIYEHEKSCKLKG